MPETDCAGSLAEVASICYAVFDMSNAVRLAEAGAVRADALDGSPGAAAKSLQGREMRSEQGTPFARGGVLPSELSAGPARRKAVELSAFFERLRQVLDDRGLSQADLARELGVGVATVSEWFTRGRVPNGDVMLRLPGALRVNGHWLLTGEGPRELEEAPHGDPYLRGASDAIQRLQQAVEEVSRRFGSGAAPRAGPAAEES
jgi:transcriptional regulator with XRE-family HTH domain